MTETIVKTIADELTEVIAQLRLVLPDVQIANILDMTDPGSISLDPDPPCSDADGHLWLDTDGIEHDADIWTAYLRCERCDMIRMVDHCAIGPSGQHHLMTVTHSRVCA